MPLFTRTHSVPASAPVPTPETWTPERALVSQRYRVLEGATVPVYTADADRGTAYYAAACLGCTYRADETTANAFAREGEAAFDESGQRRLCPVMGALQVVGGLGDQRDGVNAGIEGEGLLGRKNGEKEVGSVPLLQQSHFLSGSAFASYN